jgi:hypothetical protein
MVKRELAQQSFSLWREMDVDLAPIVLSPAALDELSFHQAIDEAYHAMVAQLHALGELAYGDALLLYESFERQEELVLAGFDAGLDGSLFTQMKEASDLVAKLGEGLIFVRSEVKFYVIHINIVSRYNLADLWENSGKMVGERAAK